jgi:single-stranded-DNA-specific exonuclease
MKYTLKYEVDKNNLLYDLLLKKGIENPKEYIEGSPKHILDPFLLKNMEKGCLLLLDHLHYDSKIHIIIDSDADGYTSSAMLYNYLMLSSPKASVTWSVHSGKEHGIIIDEIPDDTKLVLCPDAGSNNYEEHETLKSLGVDVIVLDHHLADKESENAVVINNQLCDYPNKSLSGGGIVFKFMQACDTIQKTDYANEFTDLTALSIIGDMMDLRPLENRAIIKKGLSTIKNPFLKRLIIQQSYSISGTACTEIEDVGTLTPISFAFYITPLINAMVRVGTSDEKRTMFEAFINGNKQVMSTKRGEKGVLESLATQAARNCTNAKSRQTRSRDKAIEELDIKIQNNELDKNQLIFVTVEDSEEFDTTLTGLIAMNILSKYKKPTIVARLNKDGYWRGSARGNGSSEIKNLKEFFQGSELFEYTEGHGNAHGISIHQSKVNDLIEYANRELKDVEFNENLYEVDIVVKNNDTSLGDIIKQIDKGRTLWGQGIDEPLIVIENLNLYSKDIDIIGATKDTSKIDIHGVCLMKFKDQKFVDRFQRFTHGFALSIVGRANINEYGGRTTPQIFITDYSLRDNSQDF